MWSLNPEIAKEVEGEMYERFLTREKRRKRKRRQQIRMNYSLFIIDSQFQFGTYSYSAQTNVHMFRTSFIRNSST